MASNLKGAGMDVMALLLLEAQAQAKVEGEATQPLMESDIAPALDIFKAAMATRPRSSRSGPTWQLADVPSSLKNNNVNI